MSIVTDWSVYIIGDRVVFGPHEFTCRCNCGMVRVDLKFMTMLFEARKIAETPFKIISGCRCPRHNSTASSAPNSDHIADENTACVGVDISCTDPRKRFKIVTALLQAGFDRIGWHNRFIHAGISRKLGGRNDEEVIWPY